LISTRSSVGEAVIFKAGVVGFRSPRAATGRCPQRITKMKVPPAICMKTKEAQQKVMRNTGLLRRFHVVLATIEANFGSFVFLARNPASD
jgi:hypothetical protein